MGTVAQNCPRASGKSETEKAEKPGKAGVRKSREKPGSDTSGTEKPGSDTSGTEKPGSDTSGTGVERWRSVGFCAKVIAHCGPLDRRH